MAGDDETDARVKSVASTQKAMAAGKPVTGGPRAVELLGAGPIELMVQWLGLAGATDSCLADAIFGRDPFGSH